MGKLGILRSQNNSTTARKSASIRTLCRLRRS